MIAAIHHTLDPVLTFGLVGEAVACEGCATEITGQQCPGAVSIKCQQMRKHRQQVALRSLCRGINRAPELGCERKGLGREQSR